MIQFSNLKDITQGSVLQLARDRSVENLVLDSRKAVFHEASVFFAIAGEHHNGHHYLNALYQGGLRQFVVEENIDVAAYPDANILRVPSSVEALQQLAAYNRRQYNMPVVGITGSNGKTIVKEWLFQLLSRHYKCVKNPGSYNSQIGVPLSVWQMRPYHELAIFEAGISRPGEMKNLNQIIRPTVGIFTNIGTAHDENFESTKQKITEKLALFAGCKTVIYCRDHALIHRAIADGSQSVTSWGYTREADIFIEQRTGDYVVHYKSTSFSVSLPFRDQASVENSWHCVALMLWLGVPVESIQQSVRQLQSVAMRLELKDGINQCQIIDDTYNNDLGGLRISLDFLMNQRQKLHRSIILSDILQSGLSDEELVDRIAAMINPLELKAFIGIGETLNKYKHKFSGTTYFYESTEAFLENLHVASFQQEAVLVKGARSFRFEKIIARLLKRVHGTVMEVDLGALVHNLNFFRSRIKPSTRLMVMVKAFAYGSGSVEVANVLQYHHIDYLGVAYADEGAELRRNNISIPIMVMNPSEEGFALMTAYNLEPEIYNFRILHAYLDFLQGRKVLIHLKLNTGMNRLGFDAHEWDQLASVLLKHPEVTVASIFSHLAGSDEATHDAYTEQQAALFQRGANQLATALGYKPIFHILNTPGILRMPQHQMDMVRLGIGLYGVDPVEIKGHPLKTVATLKTVVSQVRVIRKGETIGYGRRGVATEDMKVATIAIGYADGYSRAFSRGVGRVWIRGKVVPVIGNVCMDMTMIDVTGVDVLEGDEVIVFGKQHPIYEVAASINTIPYEILTNTSERIRRVFVAESI